MGHITCYKCTKDRCVEICGKCRQVTKYQLVQIILEKDPVYLSEDSRHKRGRKEKLTMDQKGDLAYAHKMGETLRDLAKKYNVSPATAFRAYHKTYDNWKV